MILRTKNIQNYFFGFGSFDQLENIVRDYEGDNRDIIYFVDIFFDGKNIIDKMISGKNHAIYFVDSSEEPSTDYIDEIIVDIQKKQYLTSLIVGIGGGATLDVAKAVSNLLTNGGKAEEYQGWDLVKKSGIKKIGIPTISGTGAESSRTCVMMNKKKNLKLGMNSEFTMFDQLILDPNLTKTVEVNQYFYTGLDTYIHCIESLHGNHRHSIADAYSHQAIKLCREVFNGEEDMMSDVNREKLMVASYLGGCAIANSYVGVVHPLSAGLSLVLGIHHCLANCLVLNVMEEFYPQETEEFHGLLNKNNISLPNNLCKELSNEDFDRLFASSIIHEKPLTNALGENFKEILTLEKVTEIFKRI